MITTLVITTTLTTLIICQIMISESTASNISNKESHLWRGDRRVEPWWTEEGVREGERRSEWIPGNVGAASPLCRRSLSLQQNNTVWSSSEKTAPSCPTLPPSAVSTQHYALCRTFRNTAFQGLHSTPLSRLKRCRCVTNSRWNKLLTPVWDFSQ